MDPDTQDSQLQHPASGMPPVTPHSGSDWQRQAVAAARAGVVGKPQLPIPGAVPVAGAEVPEQPVMTSVPAWQQGILQPAQTVPTPPAPSVAPQPQRQPLPGQAEWEEPTGAVISSDFEGPKVPVVVEDASPRKKLLIIGGIVLLLLLAGGTAAFVLLGGRKSGADVTGANNQSKQSADTAAIDADTLPSATVALASTVGYTKVDATSTAKATIITSISNPKCSITYGTASASELPGATIDDIVNPQIVKFKGMGATVSGPTASKALVVHDTDNPSKTYKFATLNFHVSGLSASTAGATNITSHYSLAITKSGERLSIVRVCNSVDGQDVPDSALDGLEATARQMTLTPGS